MNADQEVRKQLLALLDGGDAHMPFEEVIKDYPIEIINRTTPQQPYSPWALLEHIRYAQWDILDFIRNPNYVWVVFPDNHWPGKDAGADAAAWQKTVDSIRADWQALRDIVADPTTDLYADLPHAAGYTILREILVVSDHNAYHIGELALLKTMLSPKPAD